MTLMPQLLAHEFAGIELRPVEGDGPERDLYALTPARRPPPAGRADAATRSPK